MIKEIQGLYAQIQKKTEFIKLVANDLGKSPLTLRNHWFSAFWSIPDENQPRVKALLCETLEKQTSKSLENGNIS